MQPQFEFVGALSSEPVDFVAALSAEQGCDVCHELHASVDELRCATCEAAICPDCARLRPDTSWACLPCYERHPDRVFGPRGPRGGRGSRKEKLARIKESTAALRTTLHAAQRVGLDYGARSLVKLRLALVALTALLVHRWRSQLPVLRSAARAAFGRSSELARATSVRGSELTRRARSQGALFARASLARGGQATGRFRAALVMHSRALHAQLSAGMQVARAWIAREGQAALLVGWRVTTELAERSHALALDARRIGRRYGALVIAFAQRQLARARQGIIYAWIGLRSLPVRHHATALLMATLLLYAVARAEHRDA